MKIINITNKTGFLNTTPDVPVVIYDYRGIIFYNSMWLNNPPKKFNLPALGYPYYLESGNLIQLPKPINYKMIKLPKKERNLKYNPENFKILFGNNKNKCSVIWDKHIILFDNSFKNKPLFIIYFILFHEFGHKYYKTEKYCDLYARNKMLEKGFTPFQTGLAPLQSLYSYNIDRKKLIINNVL